MSLTIMDLLNTPLWKLAAYPLVFLILVFAIADIFKEYNK